MNEKVHTIHGASIIGPMADALAAMKRDLPALIEYNEISAMLWRKKYLALVNEGFTPDQALQLCSKTI